MFDKFIKKYNLDMSSSEVLEEILNENGFYDGDGKEVKIPELELIESNGENNLSWIIRVEDKYYRTTGSYQSFYGTEYFYDFTEVEPRKVEVIQWFPK